MYWKFVLEFSIGIWINTQLFKPFLKLEILYRLQKKVGVYLW